VVALAGGGEEESEFHAEEVAEEPADEEFVVAAGVPDAGGEFLGAGPAVAEEGEEGGSWQSVGNTGAEGGDGEGLGLDGEECEDGGGDAGVAAFEVGGEDVEVFNAEVRGHGGSRVVVWGEA
jgi:hypothetical protein